MPEKRLNFFIAGTQKGATTALRAKLKQHPDLKFSGQKEMHFFDRDGLDWTDPPYDKLHRYFDFSQPKLFGEATPIYMYWPHALERLRRYNPDARIVISLRHPTYRALSAWKMERVRGAETLSFEQAIGDIGRRRVQLAPRGAHRVYAYVERSQYARQVRRLLKLFPPEQVLFLTTDQLWQDEVGTLRRCCRFLGVDPEGIAAEAAARKYIAPVDSSALVLDDTQTLSRLSRYFHDNIRNTAQLTGLDLSAWLQDSYREPMQRG